MERKLELCPFCGGKVKILIGVYEMYFFKCSDCGAVVSFDSKECNNDPKTAVDKWNTRFEKEVN